MHGEEESLSGKDSPRPQLENCRKVEFGAENQKKCQTAPTSPHVVREGFKKNFLTHPKKQHIQLSDMIGTSNGTGFYGQMKLKNAF